MNRFITPLLVFSFGAAVLACAPPSLEVNIAAGTSGLDLSNVIRYRVVVRQWCDRYPAVAQDAAAASSIDLSTAVVPGELFYVWVQAWAECTNPPNICPDEILAADDVCRCVDASPRYQRIIAEGCTPWVTLAEGADAIDISLAPPSDSCPPQVNEVCE